MNPKDAALFFRFGAWETLPDAVKQCLEQETRAVADLLPGSKGRELYERLEVDLPANYTGLPEPRDAEAWRDKHDYQVLRLAKPAN